MKEELARKRGEGESASRKKEELICERIIEEIGIIEDKLTSIKWISMSNLDDRVKSLESASSSLSDKITSLCERIPIDYKNRAGIIGEDSHREKELNAQSCTQSLEIKLSKFSGYNSTSDVYFSI